MSNPSTAPARPDRADRLALIGICGLTLLLAPVMLLMPVPYLTGDEPRYLLYAVSIVRHGALVMPVAEWERLIRAAAMGTPHALPAGGDGRVVMNSVYLPALLAPVAGLFSLPGLRLCSLAAGTAGLFALVRLCSRAGGWVPALAATALAAVSLPLLPYLHLFYMESFLFALVCWGWHRLQRPARGLGGDLLTAVILILIPFVHMRGSVVAACLFAALLWRLRVRGLVWRAGLLLLLALTAAILFVLSNLHIYGAVTGPVNTARPPLPWAWFPVLATQLFNVHHGLFAYAPLWALGYAGLWAGARSGPPVLRQALVLAVAAALSGVGANPGECWPARFWILSLPMLAVGLCFWLSRTRGVAARACFAILLLATLLNSALFVSQPNLFLENRQNSLTWDALHWRLGVVDPGLFLPAETALHPVSALADWLALAAGLFILFASLAVHRRAWGVPALLVLLVAVDLCRVARLPPGAAVVSLQDGRLHVVVPGAPRAVTLEMGHREQVWFAPPAWPVFDLLATGHAARVATTVPANQVVGASCDDGVVSVEVVPHGLALPPVDIYPITLYVSRSWLRRLPIGGAC